MTDWDKTDIIHFLSDVTVRELSGDLLVNDRGQYHKIDKSRFRRCHRLMYRAPRNFNDQLDINFRSPHSGTKDLIEAIHAFGLRYDLILVDSFHYYDLSFRDLTDAFGIVTRGRSIVVHDCLPSSEELVSPDFVPGMWCGVSFIAYVDFVKGGHRLTYTTVDADYGCGIIRKSDLGQPLPSDLMAGWESVRHDAKQHIGTYRKQGPASPPFLSRSSRVLNCAAPEAAPALPQPARVRGRDTSLACGAA